MHHPGQQADRRAQQQGRKQAAQEIIAEIVDDPFAQDFLRMDGENPLQWHEDHDQDHQPHGWAKRWSQACGKLVTDEL